MEASLVSFKLSELLHEALVRFGLLPLSLAELKSVVHAQAESAHDIHYKGSRASGLAHCTVNEYAILTGITLLLS